VHGGGQDSELPLTAAVARNMLKLMAYKDEYEVARLYVSGEFERNLRQQFEGDFKLEFYMAPPLIARSKNGAAPRKMRFGALKVVAKGKALRGSVFDPFGHTAERRMERQLTDDYEARIRDLASGLAATNVELTLNIANVPQTMRGYGHVKIANVALARAREAELLHRLDPKKYPRPATRLGAGQFRGIPVVAADKQRTAN